VVVVAAEGAKPCPARALAQLRLAVAVAVLAAAPRQVLLAHRALDLGRAVLFDHGCEVLLRAVGPQARLEHRPQGPDLSLGGGTRALGSDGVGVPRAREAREVGPAAV